MSAKEISNTIYICIGIQLRACSLLTLQKADAEAAKLYEDFVESFAEDPADKGPKAFVRGEVIQPGQRPSDSGYSLSYMSVCSC